MKEGPNRTSKEELYEALSSQRMVVWLLYFFSIAMFSVLHIHRCFSPWLVSGLTLEMSIAFTVVTIIYYSILILHSPEVTPAWVSGIYQLVGSVGIWFFTACWMILYTIYIPSTLYHSWHGGITAFFVLVTLAMAALSKVPCKLSKMDSVREESIF
ncbi:hypothetical protein ACP70R_006523 [Stipagrostis hirtigluma subsp. patula]